ncbi:hypothetical protein N7493_009880 [Penicillium malachiteum]|uniref:Uncharacterized protein n=1 Tax=Penicillium malachiteum TaxID=1324776 RepID=A0AAD6HE36_9EURO|nr:hypothetical protein N7493_009880 [Penicillium malachiteum]
MSESYSIPDPGDGEIYEMSNMPISHLTPEITENNARQAVREQDDLQLRRIGKIPSLQVVQKYV